MIKLKDNAFLKKLLSSKKNKTIIIVLLIVILVLSLVFSNIKKNVNSKENIVVAPDYQSEMEQRLSKTLSKVEGAGKVSVIINLKSGMQTVIAMETTVTETKDGRITVETPVIVNGKTIVLKELYPEINGVIIVAEGAKNISVYNKLLQATMSLFNIKADKIEILTMK